MKQKNRQLINGLPRRILLMLLDCGLIVFCYYLAILLRFDGEDSIVPAAVLRAEVIRAMAPMLPYVLVIYMVVFWFGGLYEIMWEYAGMQDPHVDIAMFCIYSLYNKRQIDRLISIYFDGDCPNETRVKIYCYIAACGLLWSNWCEYKRSLGVEFGEYSLRQYRFAKEYYRIASEEIKKL